MSSSSSSSSDDKQGEPVTPSHSPEENISSSPPSRDGIIGETTERACSGEQQKDHNNSNHLDDELQQWQGLFEQVLEWIREAGDDQQPHPSVSDQLRLYGLYKHLTVGPYNEDGDDAEPPSLSSSLLFLSPRVRAKQEAWKQASQAATTRHQALRNYVELVAAQPNAVGAKTQERLLLLLLLPQTKETVPGEKGAAAKEDDDRRPHETAPTEPGDDGPTTSGEDDDSGTTEPTVPALREEDEKKQQPRKRGSVIPSSSLSSATSSPGPTSTKRSSQQLEPNWWFFGIQPLLPRGQLDIGYGDLCWAAAQCCSVPRWMRVGGNRYRYYENQIVQLWNKSQQNNQRETTTTTTDDIVVGLSVRSLWDLYLQAQKYAQGSEIVITPPITIPGMIQILQQYGLEAVAVDLPALNDPDAPPMVSVDVEAIDRAITRKTVAILVVHPFGTISATEGDMQRIRKLATQHRLDLIEDCAECFMGLGADCYLGSPYADLCLFSFGTIKTATALGGGIAVVRQKNKKAKEGRGAVTTSVAQTMQRLQWSLFGAQTTREFLCKVFKCLALRCIADCPLLYACLAALASRLGGNWDAVVRSLVQNFGRVGTATADPNAPGMFLRQQIRRRPCPELLALLHRRLQQSVPVVRSVTKRRNRCQSMNRLLLKEEKRGPQAEGIRLPGIPSGSLSTYWLYPVLSQNPSRMCRDLWDIGVDATRGGPSQLTCIDAVTCPRAAQLMEQVCFLPMSHPKLSTARLSRMALSLKCGSGHQDETSFIKSPTSVQKGSSTSRSGLPLNAGWYPVVLVAFLRSQVLWTLLRYSLQLCVAVAITAVLSLYILRWTIADQYLKSSFGFAKYNDVLLGQNQFEKTDKELHSSDSAGLKSETTPPLSQPILDSMKVLELPLGTNRTNGSGRTVVLTGATGFIGSMLLRDLLLHRDALSIDVVVVICRAKRGLSAMDRIGRFMEGRLFDFLSKNDRDNLVHAFEGDVTKPDAGLCSKDVERISAHPNISHVFHCAASVSFTQSLPDAAEANISSALNTQAFTARFGTKCTFVHMSTAFVHGGLTGTESQPLSENLHSLGVYDPAEIYQSMQGTLFYASKAMNDLRFPNSYTFSKCVCEHLLQKSSVKTHIIRPSIVGPSVESPFEGWAGEKPSTLIAAACLYLRYPWSLWSFGPYRVPCIPVDVLTRFIIATSFRRTPYTVTVGHEVIRYSSLSDEDFEKVSVSTRSSNDSDGVDAESTSLASRGFCIHNATWDTTTPSGSAFTWTDYAFTLTQVGSVLDYVSRPTAYLGLLVSTYLFPKTNLTLFQFERAHSLLVRLPIVVYLRLCELFGCDTSKAKRMTSYLELPVLFFRFMNASYHFHSALVAPTEFSGQRYVFSCVAASHAFLSKLHPVSGGSSDSRELGDLSALRLGGYTYKRKSCDALWALTQPRGGCLVRFAAWTLAKVFHATCSEISVDVASFVSALNQLSASEGPNHLILAPTHRSLFDFLVLGFVLFSLPELQIDMPMIAAADDFERLSVVGWLCRGMGAFFIRRGNGRSDCLPGSAFAAITGKEGAGSSVTPIEIFLEGRRSRDRRFLRPKIGLLKCLQESGESFLIVPITISYDRIPEQEVLVDEACGGGRSKLALKGLFSWLKTVIRGQVRLGRVHLSACEPVSMTNSSNCSELAVEVQRRQQDRIYLSNYHVEAASRLLGLHFPTVRTGLSLLGCKYLQQESLVVDVPTDSSELCSIFLQCSTRLAPLYRVDRPRWSEWLSRSVCPEVDDQVATSQSVSSIADALGVLFDKADRCVERATVELKTKGFQTPHASHVLEVAVKLDSEVPRLLIMAACSFQCSGSLAASYSTVSSDGNASLVGRRLESEERLGFWGFQDSGFVLMAGESGDPYVTMTGKRYALGGKRLTKLVPFIEKNTGVQLSPLNDAFRQLESDFPVSRSVLTQEDLDLLKDALSNGVSVLDEDRLRHGAGHSQGEIFQIRSGRSMRAPDAVVWPSSEEEVENVVSLAKKQNWCLIPYGGGTNVSQAISCPFLDAEPRPILSVDTGKLNHVHWVNEEDGLASVEAGITGRGLVQALEQLGFTVGHEPDSFEFSTVGGWIATKSSGMKRNRYGNIEDIVTQVRVVGPNGTMVHGREEPYAWGRESCGIDLSSLMIGSEGCLGIITGAVIRIWPLPEAKDFDSILMTDFEHGLRLVREISRLGYESPASCRLLDNEHFRLGQALRPESDSWIVKVQRAVQQQALSLTSGLDPNRVVCVTINYEGQRDEVAAQKRAVARLCAQHGGVRLGPRVGRSGYELTFMIAYLRDFAMTYHFLGESFETFSPWSRVELIVRSCKNRIQQEHATRCLPGKPFVGCRVTQLYHDGVCLYFYLCINVQNVPNAEQVFADIEHAARSEILECGGSLSHHHGIGKARSSFLPDVNSSALQHVLQSIKQGIDPENIFGARNGAFAHS